GLWPSIVDEVRSPPATGPSPPTSQTARTTHGIGLILKGCDVVSLTLPLGLAISLAAVLGFESSSDPWLALVTPGVAAAAFLSRSWLGPVRVIIDVILDVDNYLREHPLRDSPRVLIFERFRSFLDALVARGYDAVVFVAHSQGTVIVVDYLRWT